MRLGTANAYDRTLLNITNRQASLAELQEKLSAGKKVLRASDDPTGAAQSERAQTRITRVEIEQRALSLQKNSISLAESTLGDAQSLMQQIRQLVVQAGDATLTPADRASLAQEMRSLRDQLFTYANKQDSNGVPLFGGLASANAPFVDLTTGVTFNGIPGQKSGGPVSIPSAMDGQAVFMNVPSGNGVFNMNLGATNTGQLWTDPGRVLTPGLLTGDNYTVTFNVTATLPPVTTYDVVNTTTATPVLTAQPYVDGQDITFDGLSFVARGVPANGDTLAITPSTRTDIFAVVDAAIAAVDGQPNGHVFTQNNSRSLSQLDSAMDRIQSARGTAGELLKRADIIDSNQEDKTIQLEADRSRAEDMDMVKGISQFETQQLGYNAALQTYAQIQRLSLFNYIS
ncbi:MAG TPA: flagellar hook-associated protein 3 [Curvibacter sp.]|nr:flagellar hook-associated protein 3 [Curvibacter sp.]